MKKFDVLSLGSIYLDINATNFPITDSLKIESETIGEEYHVTPGGSAVIFSLASSSLGLKPIFIGKIGNDIFGNIVKQKLEESGVYPALIQSNSERTNLGINFVNPAGQTLMTVVGSANQSIQAEEIVEEIYQHIDDVSYLYLGGYFKLKLLQNYYPEIISKAKQKNVKIVLDHGRISNKVTKEQIDSVVKLLPQVDIYLPSKEEFLEIFSVSTINEGLRKVLQINPNLTTIVKNSKKNAVGIDQNNKITVVDSIPVSAVNTVGAGDTFNAGFIKAQIDGKNLKESMLFAHKVASFKISKNSYPKLADLLE